MVVPMNEIIFGVLPRLRNLGIGTRLITVAEDILRSKGFRIAEIGVEKDILTLSRALEKLGYQATGDNIEEWDVTTPDGKVVHEVIDKWIMQKALANDGAA